MHVAIDNHHFTAHGYIHHSVLIADILQYVYIVDRDSQFMCALIFVAARSNDSNPTLQFDINFKPLFFCACVAIKEMSCLFKPARHSKKIALLNSTSGHFEKVLMAMRFIGCAVINVVPHYALLCYTVYAMLCLEFSKPN